jgi:hypothetical protein
MPSLRIVKWSWRHPILTLQERKEAMWEFEAECKMMDAITRSKIEREWLEEMINKVLDERDKRAKE